ncbi:hypothetical protein CYMTET_16501 [Cymbomonas tetramitiformis]|uniref:Uncharacterized protein n=1 Tax=Cymbomonas tetramitiformis TaxID=36881 RepID=A0AAE0GC42_9CHLO|nr:hypothetical protein CYMTET_16501 [Cymbomonas tetramitiformis]
MQLVPSSNPSGCECYTGNAVMTSSSRAYGSFGGYITFAAYITSGTDDGITVLVNAECYGNYQVSSGIVLGQKPSSADDDDDVIAIAIGVSVSVLVLLMICFGIFLVQQRRQQNNQHTIPGFDGVNSLGPSTAIPIAMAASNSQVTEAAIIPCAVNNLPDSAEKRAMLMTFYHKHKPSQVAKIDDIMASYTLDELREACLLRYNADPFEVPAPLPKAAMAQDAAGKRTMLVTFYQKHNPEHVAQVDTIMSAYTVDEIRDACQKRYNVDPFRPLPSMPEI